MWLGWALLIIENPLGAFCVIVEKPSCAWFSVSVKNVWLQVTETNRGYFKWKQNKSTKAKTTGRNWADSQNQRPELNKMALGKMRTWAAKWLGLTVSLQGGCPRVCDLRCRQNAEPCWRVCSVKFGTDALEKGGDLWFQSTPMGRAMEGSLPETGDEGTLGRCNYQCPLSLSHFKLAEK